MSNKFQIAFLDLANATLAEQYFSEMAQKGFFLKKINYFYYVFVKGEPSEKQYRVLLREKKLHDDLLALCKNNGWQFISRTGRYYVFSSDANSIPWTASLQESIDNIEHRIRRKQRITVFLFFAFIRFLASKGFFSDFRALFETDGNILFFQSLLYILVIAHQLLLIFYLLKTRRQISIGEPIVNRLNWKYRKIFMYLYYAMLIALIILTILRDFLAIV